MDGNAKNGFEAYYDSSLNITWLKDAGGLNSTASWDDAQAWVSNLNIAGVSGWRLPAYLGTGGPNYNFQGGSNAGYRPNPVTSELAHLYYITLGNAGYPSSGYGVKNTAEFDNIASYYYWLNDSYGRSEAWLFSTEGGNQGTDRKVLKFYAWAVHAGDVGTPYASAVPEPSSLALFAAGLGLMMTVSRRKKVKS